MTATAARRSVAPSALGVVVLGSALWGAFADAELLVRGMESFPWVKAAGAAVLYLGTHLLRILRMLVLLGDTARSVRAVAFAHAATAPVSGLLPFKVGELVRVHAVGLASDGPMHGLRTVWVERTFDAAVIAVAGLAALVALPQAAPAVLPVTSLALAVLGVTATALIVLPENVGMVKAWLIRRYTAAWTLRALRLLHELGRGLRRGRQLVRGKLATLVVLTLALWMLEVCALYLLIPEVEHVGRTVVAGMLTVLSDVFRPVGLAMHGLGAGIPIHRWVVYVMLNTMAFVAVAALAWRVRR